MNKNIELILNYTKSLFKATLKISLKKKKIFSISRVIKNSNKIIIENYYTIYQELFLLKTLFSASKSLVNFFKNPIANFLKKEYFLFKLFPGFSPLVKSFIKILLNNNHFFLLPEILKEFYKMIYASKNFKEITLILGKNTNTKFLFKLLKNFFKSNKILLTFFYDKNLLGGCILKYDSITLDLSLLKIFRDIILLH